MIPHRRRGVCPSLAVPMQTGDGFLARLNPGGQTVPLDTATALCEAAHRHGNGIIEVTSRGSLQVRGLTLQSAPSFVNLVAELDIDVADGVPITVDPLAGLAADEVLDASALAHALRVAIHAAELSACLAPKVAVAIDSGGALHLDGLSADIRLRAVAGPGDPYLLVAVGGTAGSAAPLGAVALNRAVDTVLCLLKELAARGEQARAREVIRLVGAGPFRAAIADHLADGAGAHDSAGACPSRPRRPRGEAIGSHPLRDGSFALGIGLPFGHTDVDSLTRLIELARRVRAAGLRAAPDRALLIIGVAPQDIDALAAEAATLGFVTRAADPRRSLAVCPGAPFCACTDVPMRTLAPDLAAAAPALFDTSLIVHLSGCTKGCAFQGPAALTVVGGDGRCNVIVNGAVRDRPAVTLTPEALRESFVRLAEVCTVERMPGEGAGTVLSRLGPTRIAAILAGAPE